MASEWPTAPLDSLVDDILDRRGVTVRKLGSDFAPTGHRVISAKLIKSGTIDLSADEPRFVDDSVYRRWMRTPLLPGDVILTSEAPLGEVAYIREELDWCLGQRLFAIRTDRRRLDGRFLYYALQSDAVRPDLLARATGTTAEGIRQSELRRVRIPVPPLAEQTRIAGILGPLDDKIDLNRRMSQTLESMARAVFKSWFVDFDPVRANTRGNVTGLATRAAAIFPDSFEDSRLGAIPSGWRASTVGEEFRVITGQSPPGNTYNLDGAGVPFYQGRADFGDRFPSRRVYCTAPTRRAATGDTLVCVRAPVGDTNQASEDCAIGRELAAARHRSGATSYTYWAMRNLRDSFATYEAAGTVFGAIARDEFRALPVIAPTAGAVAAFEEVAGRLDDRVASVQAQLSSLTAVRNALLSVLVSGQRRAAEQRGVVS